MIAIYFKTAWRNLKANKFYSVINVSGLAVGLATGIMLLLWVQHERSYDKLHQNHNSIYKLSTHFTAGTEEVTWQTVPAALSVFSKSIPQISDVVRISSEYDQLLADQHREKIFDGNITAYVDSSFFSIFDFEIVEGSRTRMFRDIQSVVLTRSTATKLFGTDSSYLGKALRYKSEIFTVSGIIDDFPENSSLNYPRGRNGNNIESTRR